MSIDTIHERMACISSEDHKRIVRYISSNFSRDQAEDCVQEAYLLALVQGDEIRDPDKLLKWIVTVAKRIAIRKTKDHRRFRAFCVSENDPRFSVTDDFVSRIALADAVSQTMKRFPPCYGEVLRMRYCESMNFNEIGLTVGMHAPAVRRAHLRMIKALKKELH